MATINYIGSNVFAACNALTHCGTDAARMGCGDNHLVCMLSVASPAHAHDNNLI